jgi:heme/copper-type cytochrome/quinol oxidase subunit 2
MKRGIVCCLLIGCYFLQGCKTVENPSIEVIEEVEADDLLLNSGEGQVILEGDMNEEFVYDGEPELVDPVELVATIEKNGVLTPNEFHVKKGEYALLKIKNNIEEHAIVIPEYGWRTILHEDEETEFGFRARNAGAFSFHCSQYCTQNKNHIRGTIYVE